MRALPRPPLLSLGCLALVLLAGSRFTFAADEIQSKRVHFKTADEVELSGTFYRSMPAAGKRDKDAVVLLLHDFRHKEGGGSKEAGLIHLASQLQKEGYSVLTFDFRGFGKSTSVNAEKFWLYSHNRGMRGVSRTKPPAAIDQKNFSAAYYPFLVNDITAARSYLNILNDAGELNASNIIVIGAGQGATLGALWMASECRRQRDPNSDKLFPDVFPAVWGPATQFDSPEGNDLAAAVWLTISPTLENRNVGKPLTQALVDTAKTAKIPTYFLYGSSDRAAETLTNYHMKAITMENGKELDQKGVKKKAVPGVKDLKGSKMLGVARTGDYIVDYLNRVLEDRGVRVKKAREDKKFAFCWTIPWPEAARVRHILAKVPGETVTRIIDPRVIGLNSR